MSLVIGGMFHVEAAVNLIQRGVLVQRRSVDKLVILPVHRKPVRLQFLIGTVAEVAPLRAGRYLVDGKVGLRWCFIIRGNISLHCQPGSGGLLFQLCLNLFFVVLQALVEVGKLRRLRQVVLALHGKINAELGLVVPMARIARLLPVMASGAVQLLENGLGFMQRHLLAVFQMGAFTPKDRDNRLRCRILRDLPLGVGNGNLTFDLAFHKGIHLSLFQLIALFTQAVDKPDHLVGIAHGLGIGHNQLPFLAAQTRGVFLCQLN